MNAKTRSAILSSVWFGLAALALLVGTASRTAHAQLRLEVIPIESTTLTSQQILTGETQGKPVTIAGELRLPRGGQDKLPAVILVHGFGGLLMNMDDWARVINGWGVAVFIQDSLSGRGIIGGTPDDAQLSSLARMIDTYRSLGRLAQHPRIDPNRIAVMGFSYGSVAALWSSAERFRKIYGPPNVQFAAHIGVYALCTTQYRDDDKVAVRPIRLFHGIADDWNPIEPCRAYVARLKKSGADVSLTGFPGATHAYDITALKERLALPQAVTSRHCSLAEGEGGQTVNSETGKPFDRSDPCFEKGVNIQYDEAATMGTREGVKALLVSVFGLKL
jgi:dienelactone hydrolase